jgi:hypothetical protein
MSSTETTTTAVLAAEAMTTPAAAAVIVAAAAAATEASSASRPVVLMGHGLQCSTKDKNCCRAEMEIRQFEVFSLKFQLIDIS